MDYSKSILLSKINYLNVIEKCAVKGWFQYPLVCIAKNYSSEFGVGESWQSTCIIYK